MREAGDSGQGYADDPNLAIHMNREANSGYKYNVQKDLLPLYGLESAKGTFFKTVAEAAGVQEEDILGHDLFLYNRMPGTIWGSEEEFVSAPRLDDLQCAFSSMEGLIAGKNEKSICVHMVMDNEEVGSGTRQGAASTFLRDTLLRINLGLGRSYEDYLISPGKELYDLCGQCTCDPSELSGEGRSCEPSSYQWRNCGEVQCKSEVLYRWNFCSDV